MPDRRLPSDETREFLERVRRIVDPPPLPPGMNTATRQAQLDHQNMLCAAARRRQREAAREAAAAARYRSKAPPRDRA